MLAQMDYHSLTHTLTQQTHTQKNTRCLNYIPHPTPFSKPHNQNHILISFCSFVFVHQGVHLLRKNALTVQMRTGKDPRFLKHTRTQARTHTRNTHMFSIFLS